MSMFVSSLTIHKELSRLVAAKNAMDVRKVYADQSVFSASEAIAERTLPLRISVDDFDAFSQRFIEPVAIEIAA